jgi:hypothetical protein
MQPQSAEQLKTIRLPFLVNFIDVAMYVDTEKYFAPYTNDSYLLLPDTHIGRALWSQQNCISMFIEKQRNHAFFSELYDKLIQYSGFESFIVKYQNFIEYTYKLEGKAWKGYIEHFETNKMNVYYKSDFRFDIDGMIKDFWQRIKVEGHLEDIYPKQISEAQLKVCKLFVHHYINRLPMSELPHFSDKLSLLEKLQNWFNSL